VPTLNILKDQFIRIAQWLSAIARVKARYVDLHGRHPNIWAPRRFTEKMQWRKLFEMDPRYALFCDKLAVRAFIASRIGDDYLAPLIWSGASAAEIPFDRLAAPYVLKSNNAAGQTIMIGVGDAVPHEVLRARAAEWLTDSFGVRVEEPGYLGVPPRLLVEKTLTADEGERPEEVRLFVFDGKVAVINTVFIEEDRIRNGAFHTTEWTRLNWHFSRLLDRDFSRPRRLSDMIDIAERLGEGLDHVRVDFYDCGERIYVGEMTMYSWSGLSRFNPDEADEQLGAYWQLKRPFRRALKAVLFGRREIVPIEDHATDIAPSPAP
jgi:teichuronopeptide biosynthesis TupA-like protein